MATYAAFKHVELYNVGKAKKRVLKPPGGGSSDIFGTSAAGTPRAGRNNNSSNIFSAPEPMVTNSGDTGRRLNSAQSSHNRLFGEPTRPQSTNKGHMKSNIPIGDSLDSPRSVKSTDTTNGNGNGCINGNGKTSDNGDIAKKSDNLDSPRSDLSEHNDNFGVHENEDGNLNHQDDVCDTVRTASELNEDMKTSRTIVDTDDVGVNGFNNYGTDHEEHDDDIKRNHSDHENGSVHDDEPPLSPKTVSKNTAEFHEKRHYSQKTQNGQSRNPVTGMGIDAPTVVPRKMGVRRGGNPVTGEGYGASGGSEINTTVPSLNGTNQVINKNRIPPGGYSSGLW